MLGASLAWVSTHRNSFLTSVVVTANADVSTEESFTTSKLTRWQLENEIVRFIILIDFRIYDYYWFLLDLPFPLVMWFRCDFEMWLASQVSAMANIVSFTSFYSFLSDLLVAYFKFAISFVVGRFLPLATF